MPARSTASRAAIRESPHRGTERTLEVFLRRRSSCQVTRYARERGADAASAALMKHVSSLTKDRRHTVHSLRHNMKDLMRKAGIEKTTQDMVLGHSSGDIGEDYGGDEGRLASLRVASDTSGFRGCPEGLGRKINGSHQLRSWSCGLGCDAVSLDRSSSASGPGIT